MCFTLAMKLSEPTITLPTGAPRPLDKHTCNAYRVTVEESFYTPCMYVCASVCKREKDTEGFYEQKQIKCDQE